MKKVLFLKKLLWLLCLPLLFTSCEDKMDEHYEIPDWVADNAWNVLGSGEHGNFSIFMQGAERAGFKQMLEGKAILTVMAPDDNAFRAYLSEKGYASINDMPLDEVKKVIGYHLLYYSYNKEKLVNFRPAGDVETEEEQNNFAGMYYKHRTRSSDAPTMEANAEGSSVMVYHLERFLPVFSYRFFQTKGIDARSNYNAFFPNSTWTGDDGFNVANASVKEYGIIANNGYIYNIDRVLEPLETIYTELKRQDDYSIFLNLYDSFGQYVYDETLSDSYAAAYGVDSLYRYQHGDLPSIALECSSSSVTDFTANTAMAYSIFAPTNTAIGNFFDRYWKAGGYSSLQEVDPLVLNSFLCSFIYDGSLVFPEEVGTGELESLFGSPLNINPAMLNKKIMCVNGALYGMDEIQEPSAFASVVGPLFQKRDARSFLYAMDGSGLMSSYTSDLVNYIMLVPTADQFEASGIRTVYSTQGLEEMGDDGWAEISSSAKQNIISLHSAGVPSGQKSELPEKGTKVITTRKGWNFWFVKDGEITCNAIFNRQLNPQYNGGVFFPFTKLSDASNGTAYSFDCDELFMEESADLGYNLAICADKNYEYYCFAELLRRAGIASGESLSIAAGRLVAFIPTNDAVRQALAEGRIPGATGVSFNDSGELDGADKIDKEKLANYLKSYFISDFNNVIPSYPYPGSDFRSGRYVSERAAKTEGETVPQLVYTDNGTSLSIRLEGFNECHVISKYHCFPFAYENSCFHLIDDVF